MRRALVVCLLPLAACGGPSDEDQVRDVVERFGAASAKKDYQAICDDLLSRKLTEKVEQIGLPCELAFRQGLDGVREPKLTIRSVRVRGDRAFVEVRTTARNQPASMDTLELERRSGEWRIAALDAREIAPAP